MNDYDYIDILCLIIFAILSYCGISIILYSFNTELENKNIECNCCCESECNNE